MPRPKPVTLGPWPRGVDNVSPDHGVAKDALRAGVNVDVLDDGTLRRRAGLTLRASGSAHSAWPPDGRGSAFYAVVNGTLTRYTRAVSGALTATELRVGMGTAPIAYTEVAGKVYYSNGAATGMISAAGVHGTWGIERPAGQPVLAALTSGALYAGRYQVAVTFLNAAGEESGTGPTAAVSVAAGGGIQLTSLPKQSDPGVTGIRVYVSEANGQVLYRYGDYSIVTTSVTITRSSTLGKVLDTQFALPPVAGTILEAFNGRIYIGHGKLVFFTEPLRFGLMRPSNYMAFESEVRIIKGDGGAGLWIATASKTKFLSGSGPETFHPIDKLPYGAAKGAVTKLPGDKLFWMSSQGPVRAKDGAIEDLTDEAGDPLVHVAVQAGTKGACAYIESRGVRQIIACVGGADGRALVSQDYIDLPGA